MLHLIARISSSRERSRGGYLAAPCLLMHFWRSAPGAWHLAFARLSSASPGPPAWLPGGGRKTISRTPPVRTTAHLTANRALCPAEWEPHSVSTALPRRWKWLTPHRSNPLPASRWRRGSSPRGPRTIQASFTNLGRQGELPADLN